MLSELGVAYLSELGVAEGNVRSAALKRADDIAQSTAQAPISMYVKARLAVDVPHAPFLFVLT